MPILKTSFAWIRPAYTEYLKTLVDDKDVVIRGPLLVNGMGNIDSYCTRIQENLKHPHYNCTYKYMDGKINIVQTATIKANEKLSIQYTSLGEYWRHREDYPWQLYALACEHYGLPIPKPLEPSPLPELKTAHSLANPPKPLSENLLDPRYYYCWPIDTPICSMRIATLNVNGSLHDMTGDTADMVAHILDAAQISILGMTDARTPEDRAVRMKRQFHHALPHGTAVITFCTSRSSTLSGRNMTMAGQVFVIDRQWDVGLDHIDQTHLVLHR